MAKEPFSLKDKKFLIILAILGLAIILFLLRSVFVAALVNGTPISRLEAVRQLEKEGGKDVLDTLIEKTLIFQEAKRLGVNVSQESIDSQISSIEGILKEQNVTLEDALAQRGQTKEELVEQIRIQKTVEAILGQKINITDEELENYFEENKELLEKDAKLEDVKEDLRNQIFQQKLNEEYQTWIADLKAKAKIYYFVNYL